MLGNHILEMNFRSSNEPAKRRTPKCNKWMVLPFRLVLLSSLPAVQDGRKGSFVALRTLSLIRVLEEDVTL